MDNGRIEAILESAGKRFEQAEVFEESTDSVSVTFEDNRLKEITARQTHGVGLRVIREGRIGFASTTDLREPGRLVDMAEASAHYGDEARFDFPAGPDHLEPTGTYDDAVLRVSTEDMVGMGREGLELSV